MDQNFSIEDLRKETLNRLKGLDRSRLIALLNSGFSHEDYWLITHAAFPVALTSDLLYKIWANFRPKVSPEAEPTHISFVSKVLLSPICREVSRDLYEIFPAIRVALLSWISQYTDWGSKRIEELARFLSAYIDQCYHRVPSKSFAEAQRWTADAFIRPELAAERLLSSLKQGAKPGCWSSSGVHYYISWGKAFGLDLRHEPNSSRTHKSTPLTMALQLAEGVQLYKAGDIKESLKKFEAIKGLSIPPNEIPNKRFQTLIPEAVWNILSKEHVRHTKPLGERKIIKSKSTKSLLIEILRTGSPNNYFLNPEQRYVSICGLKPQVSFSINCRQDEFLEKVGALRYDEFANQGATAEAIGFFQSLMTKLFSDLKYANIDWSSPDPLHIRLITTPFELAQLPFEFVMAPFNGQATELTPLLAHPSKKVTLTREVRQEAEVQYVWPHKPRVLFAWAKPGSGGTAPNEAQLAVLQSLVAPFANPKSGEPLPQPFLDDLLTELPNASIEAIQKKITEGVNKHMPFTHVHILAHGSEKHEYGVLQFQLILCKNRTQDKPDKIDGKKLAKALLSAAVAPTVVSLSVCDSGNVGNTILPTGSLVYQLHTAGIHCVFASQFPLTQRGSVTLVETLYRQLLNACDPRTALYETRMALKEMHPTHDWASLVAYARFPDNINEQLQAAGLKNLFGSMKVSNAWMDHAFKYWDKIDAVNKETYLQNLEPRLSASIQRLSKYLNETDNLKSTLNTALLQAEHLGLLGSAYKRKAEYLFRLRELYPDKADDLRTQSKEALIKAKDFYHCGLEANPASHWTTMQYLSLKAVIEGAFTEDDISLWHVTKFMAGREANAKDEQDRIWAWGTLAELFLLKPLTVPTEQMNEEIIFSTVVAREYLRKLALHERQFNYAKESTAKQLDHYINWWPELFPETFSKKIQTMAKEIRDELPELVALQE